MNARRRLSLACLAVLAAFALAVGPPASADEMADLGKPEKAIKVFQAAVEKAPDDSESWFNLGLAHYKAKSVGEAAKAMGKALELNPSSAKTHYWMGRIQMDQKKSSQAVASFERASEIDPTLTDAFARLGDAAFQAGEWDKAIATYRALLDKNPADVGAVYTQLGTAFLKKGDSTQAIRWFQRTTEIAPQLPETWYNLGATYRKMASGTSDVELWSKSGEMYAKYLEMRPDDAIAMFFAAEGFAFAGRNADAKAFVARYLAADPGGKKAIARFGDAGKTEIYDAAQQYQRELK